MPMSCQPNRLTMRSSGARVASHLSVPHQVRLLVVGLTLQAAE